LFTQVLLKALFGAVKMHAILQDPAFDSPSRRPTTSLGILGAVQKQAVAVLKARLPENELVVRRTQAGIEGKEHPENFVCGVDNVDAEIMSVYPNELVFTQRTFVSGETNMQLFINEHPVHGKQFVTGDIQIAGFTAFNGLGWQIVNDTDRIVYMGKRRNTCLD
jgi:hypothetical protein